MGQAEAHISHGWQGAVVRLKGDGEVVQAEQGRVCLCVGLALLRVWLLTLLLTLLLLPVLYRRFGQTAVATTYREGSR